MLFASSAAVALLASVVAASTSQTSSANSTIDPDTVSATLRSQWCNAQISTCGTLCSGDSSPNTCDPDTLDFNCTCAANNSSPGLAYYTQTMPTFICEQIYSNCIAAGENDAAAQALCNTNEKANCGHLDPDNVTIAAATTTSASATASSTSAASVASGTGASSSSSKAAAATMAAGRQFGTGALAVGAAAAFGFLL